MTTQQIAPYTEVRNLIVTVFEQMGGRGGKAEVIDHVLVAASPHLREYLVERGLSLQVGAFFREQGADGLPQAPEVDEHGTHAQLELLDVGEWRYVVARYMASSKASREQALRAQQRCLEMHGVLINLDDPWAESA